MWDVPEFNCILSIIAEYMAFVSQGTEYFDVSVVAAMHAVLVIVYSAIRDNNLFYLRDKHPKLPSTNLGCFLL